MLISIATSLLLNIGSALMLMAGAITIDIDAADYARADIVRLQVSNGSNAAILCDLSLETFNESRWFEIQMLHSPDQHSTAMRPLAAGKQFRDAYRISEIPAFFDGARSRFRFRLHYRVKGDSVDQAAYSQAFVVSR